MFDSLGEKLGNVFKKLGRRGVVRAEDIRISMKEIRMALLEADVNYKVVKDFIARVEEKATGEAVLKSLTPEQQVIKIVRDELINIMGTAEPVDTSAHPTIIMVAGLQGAGKTTSVAKLALMYKKDGKKPFMIAADLQRPAAIEQLIQLGKETGVDVYADTAQKSVTEVVRRGIEEAKKHFAKVIIIDTAGRLHIDEALMQELTHIEKSFKPHETLLVVDAMTGQDAVNVAKGFLEKITINGVIMTKLDGDARGGAALSLRMVTGKPIKFIATGEKIADFEVFQPDRLVSRILGMGDVLSLIERAEDAISEEEAKKMEEKLRKADFTLEDFLEQIKMIKKMGSLSGIMKMMPGIPKDIHVDDKALVHVEAIIQSMTPRERQKPAILNASRKKRIAKGSGQHVSDVNRLLNQFEMSKKMMKKIGKGGLKGMTGFPKIPGLF